MGGFLNVERRGAVVHLTFDDPRRRNALGPAFWDGMAPLFGSFDADPDVRCVVVSGAGAAFTSGLDLVAMGGQLPIDPGPAAPDGARQQQLHAMIRRMQGAVTCVERCRVPVIAAIHGYCLGGGVDLATACDIRWCAADAVFGIRETRLAMVADVGTLQRLPAIVGPGRARELVFTGRDFGAEEALRIGLVDRVLPDHAALLEAALGLAETIAANPPLAVQGAKRVLIEAERARIDASLEYVATWNAAHLRSRDLATAITAAATRRSDPSGPTFEGR
ncbi:MAG: crotonase/enoyl-CoA hydratase family protein [Myxococcota bacterium]